MHKSVNNIDLNNSKTRAQLREVLDWCFWHLDPIKEREFHHDVLKTAFRTTHLSQCLRSNLLRQMGNYQVGVRAYSYLLHEEGWDKLSSLLGCLSWQETNRLLRPEPIITLIQGTERSVATYSIPETLTLIPLTHLEKGLSTDFEYRERHHRLWNGLQNIRRLDKPLYWRGIFPHDYDISNSAPTTLYQLAMKSGNKMLLAPINDYIENRDEYLSFVSSTCRVDRDVAKKLFTSLFNGASLSISYMQSSYRLLNRDVKAIEVLQRDIVIKQLLGAMKYMNKHIAAAFGANPWDVYFKHERANLDICRRHLDEVGTLYFLEHDGFRCSDPVDKHYLIKQIEQKTGLIYSMKHQEHVYSIIDSGGDALC